MKKRRYMIGNKASGDRIEYVEIFKIIKKKEMKTVGSTNLIKCETHHLRYIISRKGQKNTYPRQNRMITPPEKQGKDIQEEDNITTRIEQFYSEVYDSDQAVVTQTCPEVLPPMMAWEVELALRKCENWKESEKDQVKIETLKAGDETIVKELATLTTKCIT